MILHALFWLHVIFRVAADVDTKTVSIKSAANYLVAQGCIQGCLWTGSSEVLYDLGCQSPWYNQCFCNLDLASEALSFISTCVPTSCSTSNQNVATAVDIYTSYCSGAGYPFQGANVALQTSTQTDGGSDVVTSTRSSVVTATATSITGLQSSVGLPTPTPVSSSPSPTATVWVNKVSTTWTTETPTGPAATHVGGGGGGYSTSDKIALGVGIGIGLPAALSGFFVCWWTMVRR